MLCGDPSTNMSTQNQMYAGAAPGTFDYLVSTNIKCVVAFNWADGDADGVKTITCQSNGIWSNPGSTCVGVFGIITRSPIRYE